MEIQITKGVLDTRSNLVLHMDLEKRPSLVTFLSFRNIERLTISFKELTRDLLLGVMSGHLSNLLTLLILQHSVMV